MPSASPQPLLGSDELTLAVAALLSAALVVLPAVVSARRSHSSRLVPVAIGIGYAVVCLTLWGVTRSVTGVSLPIKRGIAPIIAVFSVCSLFLCFNAAIPVYAYRRERLVTPLVWVFLTTTAMLATFFTVPDESGVLTYGLVPLPMTLVTEVDPLFVYTGYVPVSLGGMLIVGVCELICRKQFDMFFLRV